MGTPQYLAPEQVDGKAVPQTDQYAIGVMLYACLTKALPYQNHASFGLLRAIVIGKFPPPRALRPELPEELEAIILRAMRVRARGAVRIRVRARARAAGSSASADAREQWRAYYLDDRLTAPPKASTHAMPLIEAMARGVAGTGPSGRASSPGGGGSPIRHRAAEQFAGRTVAARIGRVPPVTLSSARPRPPPTARGDAVKPARSLRRLIAGGARAGRRLGDHPVCRHGSDAQRRPFRIAIAGSHRAPAGPASVAATKLPAARRARMSATRRDRRRPRRRSAAARESATDGTRTAPCRTRGRWRSDHAVTLTLFAGGSYGRAHGSASALGGLDRWSRWLRTPRPRKRTRLRSRR